MRSVRLLREANEDNELSPEELENAAGGKCNRCTGNEAFASIAVFYMCFIMANLSALATDANMGQRNEDIDGRLCSSNDEKKQRERIEYKSTD